MGSQQRAYRLNIRPYGPAGIEFKPSRLNKMRATNDSKVDKTDESKTNAWIISSGAHST